MKESDAIPTTVRGRILDAAFDLFTTRGFDKTTVREIAARLGIQPGLLYYYFKDKDDILAEANRKLHETLAKVADESIEEIENPLLRYAVLRRLNYNFIFSGAVFDLDAYARLVKGRFVRGVSYRMQEEHIQRIWTSLGVRFTPRQLRRAAILVAGFTAELVVARLDGELDEPIEKLLDYVLEETFAVLRVPQQAAMSAISRSSELARRSLNPRFADSFRRRFAAALDEGDPDAVGPGGG